ncbi:MAG: DNA-processing protein DprA [Treponema sp.]|nr:DNA-processing protein DprA [Treponema sp.]
MKDLLDLIICRIPGLKTKERIELSMRFDMEGDFTVLSKGDLEHIIGRELGEEPWDMHHYRSLAEKDDSRARKMGIQCISWRDPSYPPLLREIFDPPVLLFYRGHLSDPGQPLVGMVGTRRPSAIGAARAYTLGRELGESGLPVVSGLALGIDALSHKGNLEGNGKTLAVLGSSPDMVYPTGNRFLARRILETGGCILSEYPPETGPFKWNFPERNRIISALSRGLVVVEAPAKSGALITAAFALEHGRDLWVDQGVLDSPQSLGTKRLAEEGAKVISSARDILREWNLPGIPTRECQDKDAGIEGASSKDLASSLAKQLDIKL